MSLHANAPYQDRIEDDGSILIYEGHDIARTAATKNPKSVDQPEFLPSGKLSENGKFHKAAQDFKSGQKKPDIVRVYEKIKKGIWSDNGFFNLVDSWREQDESRTVFKFKLLTVESASCDKAFFSEEDRPSKHSRIIPTAIKIAVWKRDSGKCVECGASDELHFDHILPYSKGGTSLSADNIQLLCARHNLSKSANIQ
ncbi:HNH endonuclease signature motif containing protein [Microbulbifer aestuariivivens]